MSQSDDRPNPDRLLKAITRQEAQSRRGKLKIFLGMAPGVGKTYAMLRQAQDLKTRGIDVVVGIVETHGRSDTESLLSGLPILPRIKVPYRGIEIEEFDLDSALKRRPQLCLMDELAHTNAPNQRHKKRYQDVLELLDAGIDVFTTLNIQHLESRSEVVKEITGVTIQETLPDSFLDHANEIVLIDLDPEELLKRLREGKVYAPEKADAAAQNFFQLGHLTALRELALRTTTERVDQALQDIRRIQNVDRPWKAVERLLVAVFASPYSEKLIRRTRILASAMGATWFGAYVETPRELSEEERALLAANLALVRELGGTVLTTLDENAAQGILRLARENNVSQIIVGRSKQPWWNRLRVRNSLVEYLIRESREIDIYVVTSDAPQTTRATDRNSAPLPEVAWKELLLTTLILGGVSVIGLGVLPFLGYRSVGIMYLLTVAILALFVRRPSVWIASFVAGILWNFLFIPKMPGESVAPEDLLLISTFIATAAITGNLMARLRRNQSMLSLREQRASSLYSLARQISSAQSVEQVVAVAIRELEHALQADIVVLLKIGQTELKTSEHYSGAFRMDDKDRSVAIWVIEHGRPAGRFTETLPSARAMYVPLTTANGVIGSIGVRPKSDRHWTPELNIVLNSFVQQIVSGVERELLHELARKNVMTEEADRLSRIVLNTVSHEFETPLKILESAAENLDRVRSAPTHQEIKSFAETVESNTKRLRRLVDHLLDMSRLEAGELKLNRQLHDVRNILSKTLRKMESDLQLHTVRLHLSQELPQVNLDPSAFEQIITNILDNFVVHTPPKSWVEIQTYSEDHTVVIVFRDNGPGLSEADPEAVFGKFVKGGGQSLGGSGLGLSIAKGLVESHGGTLSARNRDGGGAEFCIRLPAAQRPN